MIKLFSTFAGVGSPEMALRNIGINFEVVGISEVDKYAIIAYDAIHNKQINIPITSKELILDEIKKKKHSL